MNNNVAASKGLGQGAAILHGLAKNWWLLLLRGIAAIVFGVLAFAWPGITIVSLVIVYGAYALVDGLFSIYAAIAGGNTAPRWWLAIVGIAGVLAGIISFVNPVLVGLWLLMLIAAWAIVSGVFEIIGAIRLRKEIDNEWMLILHGVISVLFGLLLFASPVSGAIGMIWVIGAYAIAGGIILCALAFRLKKHADGPEHQARKERPLRALSSVLNGYVSPPHRCKIVPDAGLPPAQPGDAILRRGHGEAQALARAKLHERVLAGGDDGGDLGVAARRLVVRHQGGNLPAAVHLQRAPRDRLRWHVEAGADGQAAALQPDALPVVLARDGEAFAIEVPEALRARRTAPAGRARHGSAARASRRPERARGEAPVPSCLRCAHQ